MRLACSHLLELKQDSVHGLGVQEYDWLAMCTDLGLLVQYLNAAINQLGYSGANVVHLNAHMVNATARLLLKEVGNGTTLTKNTQKLELSVLQLNKDSGDSMLRQVLRQSDTLSDGYLAC